MRSRKIVLIEPPVSLEEMYGGLAKVGAVSPPLNLLLLAAIVREKGYEPYIIDCPALGFGYSDVIKRLETIQPKFAGVTAMTPHIMQAGKLAEEIKNHFPDIVTLLGGAHVSCVPEETMSRLPQFDIGFIGEADHSLGETLDAINAGRPASSVKGSISRENGQLVNTGQRDEKVSLNDLPIYAWDILEGFPHIYKQPLFSTHRQPATPILTSRGCPGKCTFCYSGCHSTLSTYTAEYTIDMLNHLKAKYGIREFALFDDNFVMFRKNLIKMLNMLIEQNVDLTWSCNSRVDMVSKDVLELMKAAGCWQISYGIETGNQDIMDSLQKNITKEKVAETISLTKSLGIRTVGYFMVGHFNETEKTIKETIDFACGLGLDDFRMSFFTPLPGTAASKVAHEYGEFDAYDWGKMNLNQPVFIPKGLTVDDLIKWRKLAIRKFFFRPAPIFSYLKMTKSQPVAALKGAWHFANYVFSSSV